MGYQESYVTINGKVDELISIIQKLGKSHFEYTMAEPVSIITLQQSISGDLDMMCHPEQKYKFNKGDKFIYFIGERSGQRSVNCMFGILLDELLNNISIIFTECFPSDRIFTEEGFALHEEFIWDKGE